jgi:hypothetical protein
MARHRQIEDGLLRSARMTAVLIAHTSAFSLRENARALTTTTLQKERAQGMPGARCTRSLACESEKAHEVVTTGSPA